MNLKRWQIKECFTDVEDFKTVGIWLSGIEGEGEYNAYYRNGVLAVSCSYKHSKRDGEHKTYTNKGELQHHVLYKSGKMIKDYLE